MLREGPRVRAADDSGAGEEDQVARWVTWDSYSAIGKR